MRLQECGRKVVEAAEIEEASRALLPDGERLWKPVNGWRVRRVRTGVRALPPRTDKGAMPLAGRLDDGFRCEMCLKLISVKPRAVLFLAQPW